jgi:hypothetical protein
LGGFKWGEELKGRLVHKAELTVTDRLPGNAPVIMLLAT